MTCDNHQDLCFPKNATFTATFRWATSTIVSKAVTAISLAAPAVVTAAAHGLAEGWPAAVVSAKGMTQINAPRFPPRTSDMSPVHVVDSSNVALNNINSGDFSAYTSGGFLTYYSPVDLSTIASAALTVYDTSDFTGTILKALAIGTGLTVDNTAKTIVASFAPSGVTWSIGYYQLLITDNTGKITELADGTITIEV